jgi:C4-dicarboxylate transporter, DctQ subunit
MKRIGEIWDFFQDKILEQFSRYLLLGVILLSFLEVIRRYLFDATFVWTEDVLIYFNLVAVFLYFGLAQRQKAHIELDIAVELIRRRWKRLADIITAGSYLVSLSFCVLFVWFGIKFVKAGMDFGRRTENADLLLWPFYVILLLGFIFMGVEFARSLVLQVKRIKEGKK